MTGGRGWFLAAAPLAVAALGLPWAGHLAGAGHPARVAVVAGVVLAAAGLRRRRDALVAAAAGAGAVGVLLGGVDAAPGRLALAGAVACLVLGCRTAGIPLLPVRRSTG